MMDLGSETFLKRCLDRCAQIPGADMVVVAVPDLAQDDPVARAAESYGYKVVRGSEKDVLSRYAKAAKEVIATAVMRVTSDCPLIDPQLCGEVIRLWKETQADYGCNNMPPAFPHGLDCEVFHASLLHAADELADDPYEREHVTPWIRQHPDLKKSSVQGPAGGIETLRWTLDYPEDVEMFRAIYAELGGNAPTASAADYLALCLRRSDIPAINKMRHDPARLTAAQEPDFASQMTSLGKAA
jgi:spore coat polysaccharide biosynthesis protein SpsF (cytidylyltransferase family)